MIAVVKGKRNVQQKKVGRLLNKRFQNVLEICYMRCFIAPFCKLALQHLGNGGVVLHKQYFIHLSLSFPPCGAPCIAVCLKNTSFL